MRFVRSLFFGIIVSASAVAGAQTSSWVYPFQSERSLSSHLDLGFVQAMLNQFATAAGVSAKIGVQNNHFLVSVQGSPHLSCSKEAKIGYQEFTFPSVYKGKNFEVTETLNIFHSFLQFLAGPANLVNVSLNTDQKGLLWTSASNSVSVTCNDRASYQALHADWNKQMQAQLQQQRVLRAEKELERQREEAHQEENAELTALLRAEDEEAAHFGEKIAFSTGQCQVTGTPVSFIYEYGSYPNGELGGITELKLRSASGEIISFVFDTVTANAQSKDRYTVASASADILGSHRYQVQATFDRNSQELVTISGKSNRIEGSRGSFECRVSK